MMLATLLLLLAGTRAVVGQEVTCPGVEQVHLPVQCISEQACDDQSLWEPAATACGLCAGCTTYLQEGDLCDKNSVDLVCKPGYTCQKVKTDMRCKVEGGKCLAVSGGPSWVPRCDGSDYLPVQCKGEKPTGRCFCVDKSGTRVWGEKEWRKAENMTCSCTRRVLQLTQEQGRTDVTLHCDAQGNYEELQCDDGVCWCAEEKTGLATSTILPENMMTMLPCYNQTAVGSSYLRQCESLDIAQKRIALEMKAHNSLDPHFSYTNCDMDGSYGAVQQEGNQVYCVWRDDSKLNYHDELGNIKLMNCRCARDEKLYGDMIIHVCLGNGNYNTKQYNSDGSVYCVDDDGYVTATSC